MRRGGTWLALAGAVLALAACGGGGDARPEEPTLPRGLAERLAQESEGIADQLEAGDQCGAAEQADVLEDAVEQAIADGDVPDAFQAELTATARKLQNDVNCPQPEPPPAPDCDALEEEKQSLEEEKQALEEQKEDADEDERAALDEQIKALDEEIKARDEEIKECKKGQGEG
jgi:chromosome segregation ATPase